MERVCQFIMDMNVFSQMGTLPGMSCDVSNIYLQGLQRSQNAVAVS